MDYLDWRGDLPFSVSPLNEVDLYAISKIGTLNFTEIVSQIADPISIGDAVLAYQKRYGEAGNYLGALTSQSIAPMVQRLPETERFKELRLSGYVLQINPQANEQFSALTVTLPGGHSIVTFRGTDDTLLAWKENMLMSVESSVAAQRDAFLYLKWAADAYRGPLTVAGHSKGGNLAVYSSAAVPSSVQDRLDSVYSFDGPGFHASFLTEPAYMRVRDRIRYLLPRHSIVGLLLEQDTNLEIIKSSRSGVAAHDGFTWEVLGTSFVRSDSFSRSAQNFDDVMTGILESMDTDARRAFIDELFGAFEEVGAVTLTDLTEHRLKQAVKLAGSLRKSPESKKFLSIVLEQMLKELTPFKTDDTSKSV